MSEAGWIQILSLIIAAIAPIALVWVKVKLDAIKHELNSKLDEWKRDTMKATEVAVEAALARGKLAGIEAEKAVIEKAAAEKAEPDAKASMEVKHMNVENLNVPKK